MGNIRDEASKGRCGRVGPQSVVGVEARRLIVQRCTGCAGGEHAERENAGQKKVSWERGITGVRRGGCKVHDGRRGRCTCTNVRARVRLPSANRTNMACIEERARESRGRHRIPCSRTSTASVRAVGTFTVKLGQIYAKRSWLGARSIKKNAGCSSSLLLAPLCARYTAIIHQKRSVKIGCLHDTAGAYSQPATNTSY